MHPAPVDGKTPHFAQSDVTTFNTNGFALALCLLLALIGVFAFYPYIQGDVLNNFPSDSVPISAARILLAVTMVLTYPVCQARHCLLSIYYRWKHGSGQDRADKSTHSKEAVQNNMGQGVSPLVSSFISSGNSSPVRLADDSSFHVYEDDVKDSPPSPSAIHTSEGKPHNTIMRSENREFYQTKDSNSSTATSSSRSGSHEQELLNVSIDEEEIANLRNVEMKHSPYLSTSTQLQQQYTSSTPSISVRFPTILLGTPDVMGLVRKVISPIRKMTFTPQRLPVDDVNASHVNDNMDMEMDSAIHTPMMKIQMASSSGTLTQHSHNKPHHANNTPLCRNDYIVAEQKSVNPMTEEDGDNAFHDPEMGEIYFSHDSGILMRSINEDDTPPLKKQQQQKQQQQQEMYGGPLQWSMLQSL
eukprot:gene25739-33615_t